MALKYHDDEIHALFRRNVERLMAAQNIANKNQLRREGIPGTTSGRHLQAGTSPRLSTIGKFAKAFKVEPWSLLYPHDERAPLRADQPPARYEVTALNVLAKLLDKLDDEQKQTLLSTARRMAEENTARARVLLKLFPRGVPAGDDP